MNRALSNVMMVALTMGIVASIAIAAGASLNAPVPGVTVPVTLWGSASGTSGWGLTSTTIQNPGPQINANEGDNVSFSLFSADAPAPHILVIDFNSNGVRDAGEPASPEFNSNTTALVWTWTADRSGTFQYFCQIHGATLQRGTLVVAATGGTPPAPSDSTLLIVGGVIAVVIVIAAAVVMMRRRGPKTPGPPPNP
jgi:FtsP/CotA-like multicopper oxidase with cupredoxin domain